MPTLAHDYRDLYLLDAREKITVLDGIAAAGVRLGEVGLLEDIRLIRSQAMHVLDLKEAIARHEVAPLERREVKSLAPQIDGRVSLIHASIKTAAGSPFHPLQAEADRALTLCFPHGLYRPLPGPSQSPSPAIHGGLQPATPTGSPAPLRSGDRRASKLGVGDPLPGGLRPWIRVTRRPPPRCCGAAPRRCGRLCDPPASSPPQG